MDPIFKQAIRGISKRLSGYKAFIIPVGLCTLLTGFLLTTTQKHVAAPGSYTSSSIKAVAIPNPLKNAYYGDLHLHTNLSFDAYIFGTRLTIEDAYNFAKGGTLTADGEQLKREFPLDFFASTDHSEGLGVFNESVNESSPLYNSELGKLIRTDTTKSFAPFVTFLGPIFRKGDLSEVIPGFDTKTIVKSAWQHVISTAAKYNEPGKFTTFTAYEWSSGYGGNQMVHRNVIFRGAHVPEAPFSSRDSDNPEDLYNFLDNQRKLGNDALAISHNANASNGYTFDLNDRFGKPITKEYAEKRAINEPLTEVSQNKGNSETHPLLSTQDEFANFEIMNFTVDKDTATVHGSYVREGLGRGLLFKEKLGANPYKVGFVGATDLHGSLSSTSEKEYNGNITTRKTDPNISLGYKKGNGVINLNFGTGNLTGAWAEENTRESIFNALRRKETFATSGTRLKFRFFGGWNFPKDIFKNENWVKAAYAGGVPMGADLPAKSASSKAPSFIVWAIKDPSHANLDRIQVVKVWTKSGVHHEKVFDVALSDGRKADPKTGKAPAVGNTVDLKTATYTNTIGDTELSTVWTDPEFDASNLAVYYLRVLEIPTPRWSTYLAVKSGLPIPDKVASAIQERGWSSPIWYTSGAKN